MNLSQNITATKVTIASGTASTIADLQGRVPVSLLLPKSLASTAITFKGKASNNYGTVTSVSLGDAGSGYAIDDVLTVVQDGGASCTVKVLTVDTGGEVLTVELLSAGTGYSVANGLSTTVAPSGGTLATINIVSVDGEAYFALTKDDNTAYSLTVGNTAKLVTLDYTLFVGVEKLQIVTGSSETAKDFILMTRAIG
jgi:hypothetical protein